MKDKEIIALYELRVTVEPKGCIARLFKVPVTFSGRNYIPQRMTTELEEKGYTYFGLGCRLPADEIMKVKRIGRQDTTDHVSYEIHFLEGQEEAAKKLLRSFMNDRIDTMKKQMDEMHLAWINRKDQPKRT